MGYPYQSKCWCTYSPKWVSLFLSEIIVICSERYTSNKTLTESQVFVCIPSLKLSTCLETKFEAFAVCLQDPKALVVVKHLSLSLWGVVAHSGFFFGVVATVIPLIQAQKTLHIEQRNRGASSREMGLEAKQFGLQGLPLVRSKYEPELPPSLKVINSFFVPPTRL